MMRKLLYASLLVIAATSTVWSMPPKGRPYVEYVCDYYDPHTDITWWGCHHIRFDDLDGSLVEILD
jgi:hypothetical protein